MVNPPARIRARSGQGKGVALPMVRDALETRARGVVHAVAALVRTKTRRRYE
jgi:hypothetical protein